MNEEMNIAININQAFVDITVVMIRSLLANNRCSINIFILNNDLSDEDIISINEQLKEFKDFNIIDVKVNDEIFPKENSNFADRWGKQAFYRLLIAEVLPISVKRILYLDADIIINGSLKELYDVDLRGNYIAACSDTEVCDYFTMDRLCLNKANTYLNAGVILFDLETIRKDEIMTMDKLIHILDEYQGKLLFWDQDILNLLFYGHTLVIDYRIYNFLCARKRYSSKQMRMYKEKAVVYHFGGEKWHRPWNYNYVGNFSKLFWENAKYTKYRKNRKYYYINIAFKPLFVIEFELYYFYIRVKGKLKK